MIEFDKLVEIIKTLRGPNGCQWDKEQDFDTIKTYLLEETYEVIDSIIHKNFKELKEELGDVMCQVVFLSELASEDNVFSINQVLDGINNKLITRHPHVFGDLKTTDTKTILKNWEALKKQEKKDRKSVLDGIPKILPALAKAVKVQEKVSRVGFDWDDAQSSFEKVLEEINELKEVLHKNKQDVEEELGDLLFSLVNVSRLMKIDPEFALQKSIDKFTTRFQKMEQMISSQGESIDHCSLEKLNSYWELVKTQEANII